MNVGEQLEKRGCMSSVGELGEGWEIQQNPSEFAEFWGKINKVRKIKTVLELGTGRTGGLAKFLAQDLGCVVTSVDINRPTMTHPSITFIQGTTTAIYPYLKHRTFDLVFIDASHEYADVTHDYALYHGLGHIVALHDIAPNRDCCAGVTRLWAELSQDETLKTDSVIAQKKEAGIGWIYNDKVTPSTSILKDFCKPIPSSAPDVTVVSGTYNRLNMLENMISSARFSVPDGITLDFVIVDGGSTDGTLEYLRAQKDVTLIEHGALVGGVKAFGDGASAARGKYVLIANDDILFHGLSIFNALCHLETHLNAGAVAFNFDTPSDPNLIVNTIAVSYNGKMYSNPYAQVGLFPNWLGTALDWWSDTDETVSMRHYGGDTYLSARILESGLSVDSLKSASYTDLLPKDALKKINNVGALGSGMHPDTIAYRKRFGGHGVPVYNSKPLPNENIESLRIVYAPIYADDSKAKKDQRRGWLQSLQKTGIVVEFDYVNMGKKHGVDGMAKQLKRLVTKFIPHILITQIHSPDSFPPALLKDIRAQVPNMVVVNWNGDESTPLFKNSAEVRQIAPLFDTYLTTNPALFPDLISAGANPYICFPSFEPVDLAPPDLKQPAHDVVFLGNAGRHSYYSRYDGQEAPRLHMETVLRRELKSVNLGIYGNGWAKSDGTNIHNWSAQYGLMQNAKITIVDNQYHWAYGYTSDRLFKALAFGQCVVWKPCEGALELYGLMPDVHFIPYNTIEDLPKIIIDLLHNDTYRRAIGDAGRKLVTEHHHYDARTRALFASLEYTKVIRIKGGTMDLKYIGKGTKAFGGNIGGYKYAFNPSRDTVLKGVPEHASNVLLATGNWEKSTNDKKPKTDKQPRVVIDSDGAYNLPDEDSEEIGGLRGAILDDTNAQAD